MKKRLVESNNILRILALIMSSTTGKNVAQISDTTNESSWGRKISIKFYLNKKLLPRDKEGKQSYPLYARVICKKQVSDFRIDTGNYHTQEEFDNPDLFLKFWIDSVRDDIDLILKSVHPFVRDNFILANLPEILRLLEDATKLARELTIEKDIKTQLRINGYGALVPILDWRFVDHIEEALALLQGLKKIKKFDLYKDPNSMPGQLFEKVFAIVATSFYKKDIYASTPDKFEKMLKFLQKHSVLTSGDEESNSIILRNVIQFMNSAMELSTSKTST